MWGGPSPNGGSAGAIRYRLTRERPGFIEGGPLRVPLRVPPPCDGSGGMSGAWRSGERSASGGRSGKTGSVLRRRRSSSFPIKDDAGYIGYLSDDDEDMPRKVDSLSMVNRCRQELLGSDISFSSCLAIFVTVGCLLMLFLFAASPWGVPPPRWVRPSVMNIPR